MKSEVLIKTQNLTKKNNRFIAVSDIDFEVARATTRLGSATEPSVDSGGYTCLFYHQH